MSKRFKLFVGKNYGVQKVDGEVIFDSIISMAEADVLVDLLNELAEENEQLKSEIEKIAYANEDLLKEKRQWKKLSDEYAKVYEENEQLKQQIQQLQHWNKCLAEKRHQELSYKPYTASKTEKELKELLEPKLFNCSDNIKSDRYD